MPSFTTITAALALAGAVAANPVNLHKREFTIQQVQRGVHAKNGPATIVKTLRKFGKPVPENLLQAAALGPQQADATAAAAAAASSGSAESDPSDAYDSSYLTPVTVGSTTLHLDFDTGSSDLWCYSSLQSKSQLSGHSYYTVNPSKQIAGASWQISYADGSGASGKVYADKVVVGGVTATSQAVEAAVSVSSEFVQDAGTDGLLGLAFSSINTVTPTQQKTFFDTVHSQLASPIFAADLKYHAAGSYDFGFTDSSKYTGSITYGPIDNSQGFWETTMSGYTIGSGKAVSTSIDGIADTGTTLLYLPTSVVKAYYAKVSGATNSNTYGGYVFPCSAALPDFSLTFQGVSQRVPGEYINYSPVQTGSSTCFGGIQTNDGIGMSIFGDIFLKSKYVVFELSSSPRIGFADQTGL